MPSPGRKQHRRHHAPYNWSQGYFGLFASSSTSIFFFGGGEGLDCKSDATWNDKSVNSGYGRVLVRVNGKENPTIQESGIWAYAI